jgi:hypothetical protein
MQTHTAHRNREEGVRGLALLVEGDRIIEYVWRSTPRSNRKLPAMTVINIGESVNIAGVYLEGDDEHKGGFETELQSEDWEKLAQELKRRGEIT